MPTQEIFMTCMHCMREQMQQKKIVESPNVAYRLFVQTDKPIIFTCENGHRNQIFIQDFSFDLLLQWAFNDFNNKNIGGAVANFSSSLERFMELVYKIMMANQGFSYDEIEEHWKSLAKRSERQLGAFLSLYFISFHSQPFTLKEYESFAKIRNDSLHNGEKNYLKTKKYGEYVISVIHDTIEVLLNNVPTDVIQQVRMSVTPLVQGIPVTTLYSSLVSWEFSSDEVKEIEKKLGQFSRTNGQEYAKMASRATKEQKRLFVDSNGKLQLVSNEFYEEKNKNRKYRGRRTFDEYCKFVEQRESWPDIYRVIDRRCFD